MFSVIIPLVLVTIIVSFTYMSDLYTNLKRNAKFYSESGRRLKIVKEALVSTWHALLFWYAVAAIVYIAIAGISYNNYVKARTFYDATIEQYSSAIEMYKDSAILDVESAFTDLKYQGYQQSLSQFITDLREKIVKYNETIISKRIMDKNPLFNWIIIAPDEDMKIIKLLTKKGT